MGVDHASVCVRDLKTAREKYEKALKPLNYKFFADEGKAVGFAYPCSILFGLIKFDKPDFWITKTEGSVSPVHVAFAATVEQCKQFYEAALAAGFKDNGTPGPRPQYHKGYYGAFVIDDDGNNIEAVCHRA